MPASIRRYAMVAAFAISGLFAFLAFRNVNWPDIAHALAAAKGKYVIGGALVGLIGFLVRAFGWKFLLQPVGIMSGWRLFSPVAIGYMANNVLPARLGEFARAYVVGARERVSKSAALATIVVERIFDGLTLLLILAAISLFFPFATWVKTGGLIIAAAFAAISVGLALVATKTRWLISMIDLCVRPFLPGTATRTTSRINNFVVGLDIRGHYLTVLLAFAFTVLRWAFEACIYVSVIYALELQDRIPIYGALIAMVAVNIASMIPQAPGFLGSVQLACIQALGVFGIDRDTSVAYSLLVHAAFFLPITIAGILCLIFSRFSFAEIRNSSRQIDARNGSSMTSDASTSQRVAS